ncbi:MAG TPA: DNA polymerase Y family protein [Burkholderiaceae bacterium]|nr:DNA polymerase Y family protein [Burkholderiaceae bacterium]
MLWLAICLPALPLQLAERALVRAGPLVIVEGPPQRPVVTCCNPQASAAGIEPGQKLAAAQALAGHLLALERDPARERAALHELCCWAYQFSPHIAPFGDEQSSGVILETGASRRLFGGHDALHRRIARELHRLGYRASFGYAATPRAAQLIGLARLRGRDEQADAPDASSLKAALAPLPLAWLGWEAGTVATLQSLGLEKVGDVLRLPRDAFARRFGTLLLDELDRALGRQADPQPPFTPPERFEAGLELPADLADAAQLLQPARSLLRALQGFLRGRGAGATELLFQAHHSPRRAVPAPPTPIVLKLAAPERSAERFAALLGERLARVRLPQPATALALRVERLLPFAPAHPSLLPPSADDPSPAPATGWLQLAETLHARLGSERVFQLLAVDDHRPEYAYRSAPIAIDADEATTRGEASPAAAQRPLLLLPVPQPLPGDAAAPRYRGRLTLVAGPERIESGWWDLGDARRRSVHRDYFVARNPPGQTLWIYRDLAAPHGWYLHGFFA